jgi:hypothetical protein
VSQPDIKLSSAEVRKHAGVVDQTSAMIDECLTGAAHVQASTESYGRLVGPQFTAILNPFQDNAIGELKKAVSATQALADALRAVADDFDISDEAAARRLGGK